MIWPAVLGSETWQEYPVRLNVHCRRESFFDAISIDQSKNKRTNKTLIKEKTMSDSANTSTSSAKVLAIGVLGVAAAAVLAIALQKFNVEPESASGTIAPAKRIVSDQIGNHSALSSEPQSTKTSLVSADSNDATVTPAVESAIAEVLDSSMNNALGSCDDPSGPGCR